MRRVDGWMLAVLVLLTGGSAAAGQTTGGLVSGHAAVKSGKVLILAVPDGKEKGGDVAEGSGARVAAAIRDELVARSLSPMVSEHESLPDGTKEARELQYDFVLRARITEWEDNATEWSGKADSGALSVELYDLTPVLVSSATHRKRASMFAMSSNSPDRFIPELVQAVLRRALEGR